MDLQLDGKRALVTGSTAGIGFAIAEVLAREGAAAVVNGRTQGRVDEAVARLAAAKPRGTVRGIAADLGTVDGVQHLRGAAGDLDILVNNLSVFEPKPSDGVRGGHCVRQPAHRRPGIDRAAFEKEFFRSMRPSSLPQGFERPEEISALVAFVCSPLASATNGAALRADGGVVRGVI